MINHLTESELVTTMRDAFSCEGKTPEQRIATFIGLLETVEAIQANFSPDERKRRKRIAEQLQPLPEPWWRNFRQEALEEYQQMQKVRDE